jgi:dUTP pyrophosphatase
MGFVAALTGGERNVDMLKKASIEAEWARLTGDQSRKKVKIKKLHPVHLRKSEEVKMPRDIYDFHASKICRYPILTNPSPEPEHAIKIKVKRLHPDAKIPEYATSGSSGMDLYSREDVRMLCGDVAKISTGIALEIPDGYECQIRPRSGLAARGIFAILGTIDSDYRGEILVLACNASTGMIELPKHSRVAQIVFAPVIRVDLEEVSDLTETPRGGGGLGSTGLGPL